MNEIKFLGYTITAEGIKLLAERVDATVEVLLPATVKDPASYDQLLPTFHTGGRASSSTIQRLVLRYKEVQRVQ